MKRVKIIFIAIFVLTINVIHAQPVRIYKTDVYWEIIVENGDSTLQITGQGKLPANNYVFLTFRDNIKKIVIAEGITEIDASTFNNWQAVEKVILPQSLKVLNASVFESDSNIKSINLPEKIEIIKRAAFYHTGGLPDSLFLSNITFLGKRNDRLIDANTFSYTSVKYVLLPYKLDTLYTNFPYCTQLSTVIIPATVKNFTGGTFYNDTALKLVVNLSPVPQTFEIPKGHHNAFDNVIRYQCRLIVPTSAVNLYKNTPVWQDFLIEGGGLSAGASVNAKEKGNIKGVEYRFYQKGELITWKAEPVEGCTFSGWKSNGEWISTAKTLSFTITKDTMIEAVFEGEVSVPETDKKAEKVLLYPNPAHTQFTVQTNSPIRSITIFDFSGRKVLKTENSTVDVSGIAQGIYIVEIQTSEGCHMKKFIRQ